MKRFITAIALYLVCAASFGSTYQKVTNASNLTDGLYIICYETTTKVKVFQQFNEFAVSIRKENDSTVVCDDSLAWDVERIDQDLYVFENVNGEFLGIEDRDTLYHRDQYGNPSPYSSGHFSMVLSDMYGTVKVYNNGTIYLIKRGNPPYYYACYINYSTTENIFVNAQCVLNNSDFGTNSVASGGNISNVSIYKKIDNNITTDIVEERGNNNIQKRIINGNIYIISNGVVYDIFGNIR